MTFKPWLQFFRAVNLPTVPGDVLAGLAAMAWTVSRTAGTAPAIRPSAVFGACAASLFLYLFGMADNDLVGMKTDGPERPIPRGDLSPRAGAVARGLCLAGAMLAGAVANLPPTWWQAACALLVCEVVYNRTKTAVAMGLCRGLNVLCGAAAAVAGSWGAIPAEGLVAAGIPAVVWTLYVTAVTRYAAGEGTHPERRPRVGLLLGALVYLQLVALLYFALRAPAAKPLLVAGAVLLVLLRLFARTMKGVSAS